VNINEISMPCETCKWFSLIRSDCYPRWKYRLGICRNENSEYIDETREGSNSACQDYEAN
jgi:hypothetical protein